MKMVIQHQIQYYYDSILPLISTPEIMTSMFFCSSHRQVSPVKLLVKSQWVGGEAQLMLSLSR